MAGTGTRQHRSSPTAAVSAEIPNPKFQIPGKFQIPIIKGEYGNCASLLEFGFWDLELAGERSRLTFCARLCRRAPRLSPRKSQIPSSKSQGNFRSQ